MKNEQLLRPRTRRLRRRRRRSWPTLNHFRCKGNNALFSGLATILYEWMTFFRFKGKNAQLSGPTVILSPLFSPPLLPSSSPLLFSLPLLPSSSPFLPLSHFRSKSLRLEKPRACESPLKRANSYEGGDRRDGIAAAVAADGDRSLQPEMTTASTSSSSSTTTPTSRRGGDGGGESHDLVIFSNQDEDEGDNKNDEDDDDEKTAFPPLPASLPPATPDSCPPVLYRDEIPSQCSASAASAVASAAASAAAPAAAPQSDIGDPHHIAYRIKGGFSREPDATVQWSRVGAVGVPLVCRVVGGRVALKSVENLR